MRLKPGVAIVLVVLMALLCAQCLAKAPSARELYSEGLKLEKAGDHRHARDRFREAVRLKPDYVDAWRHAGLCSLFLGAYQDALAEFEEVVKRNPKSAEAHFDLGRAKFRLGQTEPAIASFSEATRLKAKYTEALYHLGLAYLENEQDYDAADAFWKAIESNPEAADAYTGLARADSRKEYFEEAAAASTAAVTLRPDSAEAWLEQGKALLGLGYVQEATVSVEKAIALDKQLAEAYLTLGFIEQRHFRKVEAVKAFQSASQVRPTTFRLQISLSQALRELGCHEDAVKAAREAVSLRPDDPQGYSELGQAAFQLLRYDEAASAFRETIRCLKARDPQVYYEYLAPYYINIGDALSRAGRVDEAFESYSAGRTREAWNKALVLSEDAIRRQPAEGKYYLMLGQSNRQLARYEAAVTALLQAAKLGAAPKVYKELAEVYGQQYRYGDQAKAYEEYLRLSPDDKDAHYWLGMAYVEVGDKVGAQREYEWLLKVDVSSAQWLRFEMSK